MRARSRSSSTTAPSGTCAAESSLGCQNHRLGSANQSNVRSPLLQRLDRCRLQNHLHCRACGGRCGNEDAASSFVLAMRERRPVWLLAARQEWDGGAKDALLSGHQLPDDVTLPKTPRAHHCRAMAWLVRGNARSCVLGARCDGRAMAIDLQWRRVNGVRPRGACLVQVHRKQMKRVAPKRSSPRLCGCFAGDKVALAVA